MTGFRRGAAAAKIAAMPPFHNLQLDRRTLLRSAAACVALPWLDAMQPARPAAPPRPKVRCLFVFAPNGKKMDDWTPAAAGTGFELPPTLQPLQPLRPALTVLSGLGIDGGRAHGDGPGDHARAAASFLTCAHPKKTGGADLRAGVSIDQLLAAAIGDRTPFASLELGLDRGAAAGVCDSGYSCAYSNNVAWKDAGTPVVKETDPRQLFARLFGDPDAAADAAAGQRQRRLQQSVLDAVQQDARSLRGRLGAADRSKLDDYLAAVREVEQRLARLDREPAPATAVPVPPALLERRRDRQLQLQLLYELLALAFATDRTRIATLMLGNGGSNRSHRFLGVPEGHHELSHHGRRPEKLAAIARIDRYHVQQLATFGQRLQAEVDAGGSLLQHSLVVYGAGIGDGDRHNHDDLPVLLLGHGGGAVRGGRHLRLLPTPMANLYLTVAAAMGAPQPAFADSTGELEA